MLGACAAVMLVASDAAFGQVVNAPSAIINQYRSVRANWLTTAAGYANRLFAALALIEFAWTGIILVLEKTDLQGWTAALIRRMMFVGAFYSLLQFGSTWIPAIIDSFVIVGQTASGVPALSPSNILARGLEITGYLLVGAAESGWLAAFGIALCMVFAALLSFLAFLGLAIQFVVATIESYLVIGAGFLFLGFGGSRWTAPYVERYIAYAVATGVKIMLIYMLIGAGFILSNGWTAAAIAITTSPQPATDALDIAASAVIFLMICWNSPKLAAAMLGGSPTLTGGDAVGTGGALLGAGAAMAGLTAAGVALGARMLAGSGAGGAIPASQAAGMGTGGHDRPPGGGGNGGGGNSGKSPDPPSSGGGGADSGAKDAGSTKQPSPPERGPTSDSDAKSKKPQEAASGKKNDPDHAKRRADWARDVATSTVVGGQAINQLRGAVPSDAAPPTPPPPLNTGSHDSRGGFPP